MAADGVKLIPKLCQMCKESFSKVVYLISYCSILLNLNFFS